MSKVFLHCRSSGLSLTSFKNWDEVVKYHAEKSAQTKGNEMSVKDQLLVAQLAGFQIVKVQFFGENREYSYLYDGEVKVGDYAVVDSPRNGLTVVFVTGVESVAGQDEKQNFAEYKMILGVVDGNRYEQAQKRMKEALAAMKRMRAEKVAADRLQAASEEFGVGGLNTLAKILGKDDGDV